MLFMQVIALLFMNLTEAQVHMENQNAPANSKIVILQKDIPYLFVPFCELAKSAVFKFQLLKH